MFVRTQHFLWLCLGCILFVHEDVVSGYEYCSASRVLNCVHYFNSKYSTGLPTAQTRTADFIDGACRLFEGEVMPCLTRLEGSCQSTARLLFEGTEKTYKYICSETVKPAYIKNMACVLQMQFDDHDRNTISATNTTYMSRVQDLTTQLTNHWISVEKFYASFCNATKTMMKKIYDFTLQRCGVNSAQFEQKLGHILLDDLWIQNLHCDPASWTQVSGHVCPAIPVPRYPHATLVTKHCGESGCVLGNTLKYRCEQGYQMEEGTGTVTCMINGWHASFVCRLHVELAPRDEYCTATRVQECVQPLVSRYQAKKVHDATSLDGVCNYYLDDFAPCLARFEHKCAEAVRLLFEGITDMYQFLCSSAGKKEYLKTMSCMTGTSITASVHKCNTTYHGSTGHLQASAMTHSITTEKYKTSLCSVTQNFYKCVYDVLESGCGAETAKFFHKLETLAVQPIASEKLHCQLGETKPHTVGGVGLQLMSFILLLSCLITHLT